MSNSRIVIASLLLVSLMTCAVPTPVADSELTDDHVYAEAAPPEPEALYSYSGYSAIKTELMAAEAQHPDIAKVYDIGDSWEKSEGIADRDILALKISDNVGVDEDEPEVLVVALHHAREWISSEIAVQAVRNLTDGYGNDSMVSWLVDNREIWIVPVVNPDGLDFALSTNQWWRKNRRDNGDGSFGVDLNRNYEGSMNNDSAGAWGGEGSSQDPSNEEFCGQSPFSEPETQAIRDLVMQRNFTVCLDFHSYGDLVMWPWGYTANLTPDDAALVSLGTQLAALNGYTPEQSVGLYPTTGDSLDWLYGYRNIFAILFEVADEFHPLNDAEAQGVVNENIPPIMRGLEIAGDKYQRPFSIAHSPTAQKEYSATGFGIVANITAARGVDRDELRVVYSVDAGSWQPVPMTIAAYNDTYLGAIPSLPAGSSVEYYITAEDNGGVEKVSPSYAPYEVYSFLVIDSVPPIADAGADIDVYNGSEVMLDGSKSFDNSGVVNYTWTFVYNGSQQVLHGETAAFTFWTAGSYEVTLNVSDGGGNFDTDSVMVNVEDPPIPEFGAAWIVAAALCALVLLVMIRTRR